MGRFVTRVNRHAVCGLLSQAAGMEVTFVPHESSGALNLPFLADTLM